MSAEARASWNLTETFVFEGQAVRYGTLGEADKRGRELVARIPGVTLRNLPGARHLVQEDAPEAVVALLLADLTARP